MLFASAWYKWKEEKKINKDNVSKNYLYDPERLADLLNYYIYHGKQIIKPDNIRERRQEYSVVNRTGKKLVSKEVRRDIVVEVDLQMRIALVAIENQNDIYYAMPVRMIKGDVFWYDEQWKQIRKMHKERRDLKGAEYISGFSKKDKLIPMLALCIYFGEKSWDGPKCLKDILDLEGVPEEISNLFMNYPIHLIEIDKIKKLEMFKSDLRIVFGFLQRRSNKEALLTYVQENEKDFRNLQEDAFEFLCAISYTKELEEIMKKQEMRGGIRDMCQAIKELIEDERRKGRRQGRRQGKRLGMEKGIYLAKKVFYMNSEGKSYDEISDTCGISVEKVRSILTQPAI